MSDEKQGNALVNMQVFENPEFQLQVHPDGDSFRVEAPGVARALGYRDSHTFVRSIPDAEKGYTLVRTPGGEQQVWYVTEAGFYRALGQRQASRIKNAGVREMVTRFQSWVWGDVMPTMRRAGGYHVAPVAPDSAIMTRLAEIAHREHVVPASGRILAHHRWHNTQKGIEAFGEVCYQMEFDVRPLKASADAKQDEITSGKPDTVA